MDLRTFKVVADAASFSLAANQLHLTQPAVSKRILQLESELGRRLFDRVGKQVSLTEAGRLLYPRAEKILNDMEATREAMAALSNRVDGELAIATSHHIGLWHLPGLLSAYRHQFPDVALDLHFDDSEVAHDLVTDGSYELALVTLAPEPQPNLGTVPLLEDTLVFASSPEHQLARQETVTLSDLLAHPAVLPDLSTFTGRIVRDLFISVGRQPDIELTTNYLEILRMLAVAGLGWTVLPQSMLAGDDLLELEVDVPRFARTLGIVHHNQRTLSNAATAFIELARSVTTGTGDPGSGPAGAGNDP